ncbi:hypothetical protein K8R43_01560 [archaeon]|nr:hypothetical protein [archaeon]
MACSCGKKSIIELSCENKKFCSRCFKSYFERKVLNSLRGHLPSKSMVGFDTVSLGGKVAFEVIQPFALNARNECVKNPSEKVDVLIVGTCLEDSVLNVLKESMGKTVQQNGIAPLKRCSRKEIECYAGMNSIIGNWPELNDFDSVLLECLESIEEKHPGIKYAIVNSRKEWCED